MKLKEYTKKILLSFTLIILFISILALTAPAQNSPGFPCDDTDLGPEPDVPGIAKEEDTHRNDTYYGIDRCIGDLLFEHDCRARMMSYRHECEYGCSKRSITAFGQIFINVGYCNPEPACGNGHLEADEECDDGNLISGDGCTDGCLEEDPRTFPGSHCGDGILDLGEECDDNNESSGDGCSDECIIESGYPNCGNGILEIGEECDDDNETSGDGCTDGCRLENRYLCHN